MKVIKKIGVALALVLTTSSFATDFDSNNNCGKQGTGKILNFMSFEGGKFQIVVAGQMAGNQKVRLEVTEERLGIEHYKTMKAMLLTALAGKRNVWFRTPWDDYDCKVSYTHEVPTYPIDMASFSND